MEDRRSEPREVELKRAKSMRNETMNQLFDYQREAGSADCRESRFVQFTENVSWHDDVIIFGYKVTSNKVWAIFISIYPIYPVLNSKPRGNLATALVLASTALGSHPPRMVHGIRLCKEDFPCAQWICARQRVRLCKNFLPIDNIGTIKFEHTTSY